MGKISGSIRVEEMGLPKINRSRRHYDLKRYMYYENLDIPLVERKLTEEVEFVDERMFNDETNGVLKNVPPQLLTYQERLEALGVDKKKNSKLFPENEANPIAHTMVLFAHGNEMVQTGGTRWYGDRELLALTIGKYFDTAYKYNMNISISGLALFMGLSTVGLYKLNDPNYFPHADLIQRAYQIVHATKEDLAEQGKINAQLYMFLAKNYFNMEDKKSIAVSNGNQDKLTAEEEQQIIDALPEIVKVEKM